MSKIILRDGATEDMTYDEAFAVRSATRPDGTIVTVTQLEYAVLAQATRSLVNTFDGMRSVVPRMVDFIRLSDPDDAESEAMALSIETAMRCAAAIAEIAAEAEKKVKARVHELVQKARREGLSALTVKEREFVSTHFNGPNWNGAVGGAG